jgi:hypothetical protein
MDHEYDTFADNDNSTATDRLPSSIDHYQIEKNRKYIQMRDYLLHEHKIDSDKIISDITESISSLFPKELNGFKVEWEVILDNILGYGSAIFKVNSKITRCGNRHLYQTFGIVWALDINYSGFLGDEFIKDGMRSVKEQVKELIFTMIEWSNKEYVD